MAGDAFTSVRIAVVGVGYLGRHHARILASLPGAELTAVVDVNASRAQDQVGKTAQLLFYDWEPNVIGPEGKPAPTEPTARIFL